jgi:hypothetical protein
MSDSFKCDFSFIRSIHAAVNLLHAPLVVRHCLASGACAYVGGNGFPRTAGVHYPGLKEAVMFIGGPVFDAHGELNSERNHILSR